MLNDFDGTAFFTGARPWPRIGIGVTTLRFFAIAPADGLRKSPSLNFLFPPSGSVQIEIGHDCDWSGAHEIDRDFQSIVSDAQDGGDGRAEELWVNRHESGGVEPGCRS